MSWRMRGSVGVALLIGGGCGNDETAQSASPTGIGGTSDAGGGAPNAGGGSGGAGVSGASNGGTPNDAGTGGSPSNEGGICASDVRASCLGTFFDDRMTCFHPAGSCVVQTAGIRQRICWSNGAKLLLDEGTTGVGFTYSSGTTLCFYGSWTIENGSPKSYTFTPDGQDLLVYERTTGKTTCLDGTQTTVSADFGECDSITSLLGLDATGCTPGSCN